MFTGSPATRPDETDADPLPGTTQPLPSQDDYPTGAPRNAIASRRGSRLRRLADGAAKLARLDAIRRTMGGSIT